MKPHTVNPRTITVDKNAFREAVLKNTKPTDHGYRQQDYDRIIAIQ